MITKLGRPYAEAFLKSLGSVGAAEDALSQLRSVEAAMEQVPALKAMAANPGVPEKAKLAAMSEVADSLGLGQSVRRLVEVLLQNYRLVRLPEIVEAFEELLNRKLGVERASVVTASELDADQQAALVRTLEDVTGSKVELATTVDPSLLGGFVATVGSRRYDTSVKGQIQRMARDLAAGPVLGTDEAATQAD